MEVSDDEAVIGGWVGDVLERGQLPLIQKSGGTKDIVDARVKPEETHYFCVIYQSQLTHTHISQNVTCSDSFVTVVKNK